ncbi:MAG TPA: hypothetical protein VJB05_00805 [archaeon]|nr:hypothetical protein [archaeon]
MLPDLLYHGTTRSYHDKRIRESGLYRHIAKPVDLTPGESSAMGYAVQRSKYYKNEPILLVVKTHLVDSNLREEVDGIRCDFLDPGWYKIFDVNIGIPVEKFLKDLFRMQRLARRL